MAMPHALCVGAAEGCDLLILLLFLKKQDQKIAAFGSSYRGFFSSVGKAFEADERAGGEQVGQAAAVGET